MSHSFPYEVDPGRPCCLLCGGSPLFDLAFCILRPQTMPIGAGRSQAPSLSKLGFVEAPMKGLVGLRHGHESSLLSGQAYLWETGPICVMGKGVFVLRGIPRSDATRIGRMKPAVVIVTTDQAGGVICRLSRV